MIGTINRLPVFLCSSQATEEVGGSNVMISPGQDGLSVLMLLIKSSVCTPPLLLDLRAFQLKILTSGL